MEQTTLPTTIAEQMATGPYTFRESVLVTGMCQIADAKGNCVGVLRKPHDAHTICAELNAAYTRGQQDRWISVKDRLPEPFERVLAWSPDYIAERVCILYRDKGGYWCDDQFGPNDPLDSEVIAWCPLPPNPEHS